MILGLRICDFSYLLNCDTILVFSSLVLWSFRQSFIESLRFIVLISAQFGQSVCFYLFLNVRSFYYYKGLFLFQSMLFEYRFCCPSASAVCPCPNLAACLFPSLQCGARLQLRLQHFLRSLFTYVPSGR